MKIDESLHGFSEPLEPCGADPVTGFLRDGKCNTCKEDTGSHTVCVEVTRAFLEFSRFRGNDLSTPMPEYNFPGLQPGDSWCLCAGRWLEAAEINMAPKVHLKRTHIRALDIVPFALLKKHAVDLN